MTADLFWPGDHRAGELFSEASFVAAMVRVEQAWLTARGISGKIGFVGELPALAIAAEDGGNPVIPLLAALDGPPAVHAGLTSQDVLDTALALCLRDAADRIRTDLDAAIGTLCAMADDHRH